MMRFRRFAPPAHHASRDRVPRALLHIPLSAHWLDRIASQAEWVEFIIQPDDAIALRRRGDNEPRTVEPILPLFVSPLLIAFKTRQQGTIRITKWQVEPVAWRNLCVRLQHLRFDQTEDISHNVR